MFAYYNPVGKAPVTQASALQNAQKGLACHALAEISQNGHELPQAPGRIPYSSRMILCFGQVIPGNSCRRMFQVFHLFHSPGGTEQEVNLIYYCDLAVFAIRARKYEIKCVYLLCCLRTTDIQKAFSLSQFDESGQFIVDLGRVMTRASAIFWVMPTI